MNETYAKITQIVAATGCTTSEAYDALIMSRHDLTRAIDLIRKAGANISEGLARMDDK